MLTIPEFCALHPQHAFDFSILIYLQPRVFDPAILADLPVELESSGPYTLGGRNRPNRNQTKTHKQCGECYRVLRNDMFFTSPSLIRQNVVSTVCKACAAVGNAERYSDHGELTRVRRLAIWHYIGPRCVICGFDRHPAAMDMHHTGAKDELVSNLVAQLAATPSPRNAHKLVTEAAACIPLCSNCHRLLHARILSLPSNLPRTAYDPGELLSLVQGAGDSSIESQPEPLPDE